MERVPINAPRGPLGLIFEPESTVLSKVRETSPLYGRVEVGWTLVGVDREDVSHMDGSQVTKLLKMRSHNPQGRHLEFKKRSFSVGSCPATPRSRAPKPHVAVRADIEFRVGSMAWRVTTVAVHAGHGALAGHGPVRRALVDRRPGPESPVPQAERRGRLRRLRVDRVRRAHVHGRTPSTSSGGGTCSSWRWPCASSTWACGCR